MRMYEELCNKYRIEQLLGNGSYGAVFQASETRCERTVAIKAFHQERYDQGTRRYLESEIRAMGKLWGHPNVVSIHTLEPGEDPYLAFLVMEYVDGPNLRSLIDRGPISLETVLRIGIDVCQGLSYAHAKSIIHRDVKPRNILLTAQLNAKLSDFGVARVLERSDSVGTVAGTRKYMAPEQYVGHYDHRVDVYATGLVLFEMLVRNLPFSGHNSKEMEQQKRSREAEIPDTVHPGMRPIIRRALMRDPEKRYQSADELQRALTHLRKQLYHEYVLQVMDRHLGSSMLESVLATRRDRWGLSPSDAYMIETEAARFLQEKRSKAQKTIATQKTALHYTRARELITNRDFPSALAELQNLVLLHLSDDQTARLTSDLFVRLVDENLHGRRTDPEWLLGQLQTLPDSERLRILNELGEGSPNSLQASPLTLQSVPTDMPAPVLPQRIAEIEESERKARYYQRRVEESKRVGNLRHARRLLKRIGRIYWKIAERLLREQLFDQIPGCYMRAARAYGEASSLGARFSHRHSRQCYLRSAKTHMHLAEQEYRQQKWNEAGECYRKASRAYDLAEKRSSSDEANRQAMLSYYQAAQELFRQSHVNPQLLEAAHGACQTAVSIGYNIRGRSTPAEQARKLLMAIETQRDMLGSDPLDSDSPVTTFRNGS